MTFTQLQVRSCYSLLESPLTIDALVKTAVDRGYKQIALTDVNVTYGMVDFYKKAKDAGLKPILGLNVQVADAKVLLIAETTAGYHQLLRISSAIKLKEQLPNLADLPEFAGCTAIVPGAYLLSDDFQQTQQNAETYLQAIAKKRPAHLVLGITAAEIQSELPSFAQSHDLPLTALGDVRYGQPNEAFLQKVLLAIKAGTQLNLRDPALLDAGPNWLCGPEEAAKPFIDAGLTEAAAASDAIGARANAQINFASPQLPHFPTPNGEAAADYLQSLAQAGLQKRFAGQDVPEAYSKRLAYELGVIDEMGFADYFLIVWDVMNHAHEVGIMTGPGRGSAAGALVSYALAITEVDPIQYHLLFERFLNPARANMPDIDLDIPDNRRSELIHYVHDRYGDNHMAQIITFGTFGAKQALRDCARVMGLSQFDSDKWSKAIPPLFHISLKEALDKSQPLKNLVNDSDSNRLLFQTALALEGLPRHDSTHAAGIVLAEEPLTDKVALQLAGDGLAQTQVPKEAVEALGLLKIDFLGLRNLSILAAATNFVSRQIKKPFDPKKIPLDDQDTIALFARADTNGVFQFESAGIKRVLRQLHPTSFEDVVAVNALFRPGPMENIDTFIARKNGREKVTYAAPALEPILKPTYGVLVYQEQVMQVASAMGGFSLGEADLLRRAMSKKKAAILDKEHDRFIQGAKAKGYDEQTAETVYAYIDRFANYGFNRSHAVAYSMIAFWLAYLKVHYPAAFFAALMNSSLANTGKLRIYVQEMKTRKLPILGPDINQSGRYFSLQQDRLCFGLLSVKGLRRDFVDALLDARKAGPFKDLRDVMARLDNKWLKAGNFEPLVEAGAFDSFDQNRAAASAGLEELMESVRLAGNDVGLFEVLAPKPVAIADWPANERLEKEAAVLGVYLAGHPVDRYVQALSLYQKLTPVAQLPDSGFAKVVLVIRRIKRIRTKKGQEMAFIDGQDESGNLSVTVFPSLYSQLPELSSEQVIVAAGKLETRDGLQLIANQLETGDQALASLPQAKLFLQLPEGFDQAQQAQLLQQLQAHRGGIPVITVSQRPRQTVMLAQKYWSDGSEDTVQGLKALLGTARVVLQSAKPQTDTAKD